MAEICTMVVLSTATLDEDTDALLREMGGDVDRARDFGDWRNNIVRCAHACGHLIRLRAHDDETFAEAVIDMPESLVAGLRHARGFGAKWINYDRDGEHHGLAGYHW